MRGFTLVSIFLNYSFLVNAQGEFTVIHSPSAVKFQNNAPLSNSLLPDVFLSSLGLSTQGDNSWNGMQMKKPSGFARNIVIFYLSGINTLYADQEGSYPLIRDMSMDQVLSELESSAAKRFGPEFKVKEIPIKAGSLLPSDNGAFNSLKTKTNNEATDNTLINALNEINDVVSQIPAEKPGSIPDIYWIDSPELANILNQRKSDSNDILLQAFKKLSTKIEKNTGNEALVAVICESLDQSYRSKRDTQETTNSTVTTESLNVADDYDENFPIIFNIILWFSVGLIFTLIAICMVIASMDPGRDSIIYRMTSTRMKKEN